MSPAEDGGAVEAGFRAAIAEILQLRGDLASCRLRRDAWKQGFDERSALVAVQAAEITRLRAEVERKDVVVKPLEWGPYPNPVFNDPAKVAIAPIDFQHFYQVQRDPWGPGYMAFLAPKHGTLWWDSKGHATLDAAKAAAQADYEQRIRSALGDQP